MCVCVRSYATCFCCLVFRFVNFYIRIGSFSSSSSDTCDMSDSSNEGVIIDYSTNGGITWTTLKTLAYYDYRNPKAVGVALPAGAQTSATRFRWWQPYNSGSRHDEWALDEVYIGGKKVSVMKPRMWVGTISSLETVQQKSASSSCFSLFPLDFLHWTLVI